MSSNIKVGKFEVSHLRINTLKNRGLQKCAHIKSDFFTQGDYYIFKADSEKLTIQVATLDYRGQTITPSPTNCGWYMFSFVNDEIPIGYYDIDEEESNEDVLVCYWSEQI